VEQKEKTSVSREVKEIEKRFSEFFDKILGLPEDIGSSEPDEVKRLRPFLLVGEVMSISASKGGKGKSKGGKGGKEMTKAWGTGPPPFLNNYIRSNKSFTFTQQATAAAIITTGAIPVYYSKYFNGGDIDQFTSFAAVFDQYKFDLIEAWIVPRSSTSANETEYASVIDYDDANNLTSVQSALDYTNCNFTSMNEGHYHRWVPHLAVASYSGTFVSYTNVTATWIDCVSNAVQHYGIKVAAQASNTTVATFDLNFRITISFRNVR
jgi:hypothetical protein